ncbi:Sumo ligase [Entamoeba marina]
MKLFELLDNKCFVEIEKYGVTRSNVANLFQIGGYNAVNILTLTQIRLIIANIYLFHSTNKVISRYLSFQPVNNFLNYQQFVAHVCYVLNQEVFLPTTIQTVIHPSMSQRFPNQHQTQRFTQLLTQHISSQLVSQFVPSQFIQSQQHIQQVSQRAPYAPSDHFVCRIQTYFNLTQILHISQSNYFTFDAPPSCFLCIIKDDWNSVASTIYIDEIPFQIGEDEGAIEVRKVTEGSHIFKCDETVVLFQANAKTNEEIVEEMIEDCISNERVINSVDFYNEVIPLRCPVSIRRMKYPVKSEYCKHQCIDAESLVENWRNGRLGCCYCCEECSWDNIIYDQWLKQVITQAPIDSEYVMVESSGIVKYLDLDKNQVSPMYSKIIM